jgi:hypothetical protein
MGKAEQSFTAGATGELTFWLSDEQVATLKALLGLEISYATVPLAPALAPKYGIPPSAFPGTGPAPILKYGLPTQAAPVVCKYAIQMPTATRMYLTAEQKKKIKDATGCEPCDYVELAPPIAMKYGLPIH